MKGIEGKRTYYPLTLRKFLTVLFRLCNVINGLYIGRRGRSGLPITPQLASVSFLMNIGLGICRGVSLAPSLHVSHAEGFGLLLGNRLH